MGVWKSRNPEPEMELDTKEMKILLKSMLNCVFIHLDIAITQENIGTQLMFHVDDVAWVKCSL